MQEFVEMPPPYEVMTIPDDAAEAQEQLGTKEKFWFRDAKLGRCLYKIPRANTGEHWAEKVAAELASLMELPHAQVKLAKWRGTLGTAWRSFVREGATLIHGNEILFKKAPGYPTPKSGSRSFYRVSHHTVDAVQSVNNVPGLLLPPDMKILDGVKTPVGVLVGYLLFDAWIGNTDRHHENWGWIQTDASSPSGSSPLCLAPTYDHASSLGRELTDQKREQLLRGPNPAASMKAYAERCRSALFEKERDQKPVAPIEAFHLAALKFPEYATVWAKRLGALEADDWARIIEAIPETFATQISSDFALELLRLNRRRILELSEEIL